MSKNMHDIYETTIKGIIGAIAPAMGVAVSLTSLEQWMRITSMFVGIAVSSAMFISIIKKLRK